jgi:hypothetical protein
MSIICRSRCICGELWTNCRVREVCSVWRKTQTLHQRHVFSLAENSLKKITSHCKVGQSIFPRMTKNPLDCASVVLTTLLTKFWLKPLSWSSGTWLLHPVWHGARGSLYIHILAENTCRSSAWRISIFAYVKTTSKGLKSREVDWPLNPRIMNRTLYRSRARA